MKIIQLVPESPFARPAAEEAELFHHIFRSWQWESSLVSLSFSKDEEGEPSSSALFKIDSNAILIYHFHYVPPVEFLLDHPAERTAVFLHRMMPPFLIPLSQPMTDLFSMSAALLKELSQRSELAFGHSYAACDYLEQLGFYRVRRIPYLIDRQQLEREPDPLIESMLAEDCPYLIFVGDLHAGSNIEDLIKTVWYCRNFTDPGLRLVIAGHQDLCPAYFTRLLEIMGDFNLGKEDVIFAGELTPAEQIAYFKRARIFLQLSSYDWTGANLMKSIHCGLPTIALADCAAAEILADAGILLDSTIHSAAADNIHRLLRDPAWRESVTKRQQERIKDFSEENIAFQLRSHLARLIS